MKTTYISRAKFGKFTAAIAAAALLAGTAAPGVLAADYTAQLTKTIDMTAAPGAGVPHGSITFTVGTVADAADDLKSECLRLGAFAVVRAGQRLQALGKADEADT